MDYGGKINKNIEYQVNEDKSGILLKMFSLTPQDMQRVTGKTVDIKSETIKFTVEKMVQYQPWHFGRINKGAGQLGIYQLKDENGKEWFSLIKDYIAFEGDWRIMLVMLKESEWDLKSELMTEKYRFTFMDYLFPTR